MCILIRRFKLYSDKEMAKLNESGVIKMIDKNSPNDTLRLKDFYSAIDKKNMVSWVYVTFDGKIKWGVEANIEQSIIEAEKHGYKRERNFMCPECGMMVTNRCSCTPVGV